MLIISLITATRNSGGCVLLSISVKNYCRLVWVCPFCDSRTAFFVLLPGGAFLTVHHVGFVGDRAHLVQIDRLHGRPILALEVKAKSQWSLHKCRTEHP